MSIPDLSPPASNNPELHPAFIIGVTGHMEIPDDAVEPLNERIKAVLRWLGHQGWMNQGDAPCKEPLGLTYTPIHLLSSLAPGADQMVARAALDLGIRVRCPLAFPVEFYRQASTFRRGAKGQDGKVVMIRSEAPRGIPPGECQAALPELSEDDKIRQKKFDELLEEIGPENAFCVYMESDLSIGDVELELLHAHDLRDRERRNRRYRAAGEYVSSYCDILIAVCDQMERDEVPAVDKSLTDLAQSGAGVIALSHLKGMQPGILPVGTTLTWADNGPVIRIFCPNARKTNAAGGSAKEMEMVKDTPVAVWHPRDSVVPAEFQEQCHERKMRELRGFAKRLDELNQELGKAAPAKPGEAAGLLSVKSGYVPTTWISRLVEGVGKHLKKLRGKPDEKEDPPAVTLVTVSPALERMAAQRRVVTNRNRHHDSKVKSLTFRLFLVTFGVVVALQLYENWIFKGEVHPPDWRVGCFYFALAIFVLGYLYHSVMRAKGIFDRQNDYRALSEGLRVQFYWSVAGTGLSVASNYLQRVRGELSWIRSAIASASFPYEDERREFQKLDDERKIARLEQACGGWLSEQESFFSRSAHDQSLRKQRLHTAGHLALIAAFALIIANFTQHALGDQPLGRTVHHAAMAQGLVPLWIWLATAGIAWLAVSVVTTFTYRAYYHGEKRFACSVKVSDFLHHFHHPVSLWIGGLWLGWAIFCALRHLPASAYLPAPEQLGGVLKNLLLGAGGLLHSYSAFKFTGENTKRYAAMRDLFRTSRTKIDDLLQRYRHQIDDSARMEDKERTIRDIHAHLEVLGKEALHENTDWLQMHRDKPVEPVLPVG